MRVLQINPYPLARPRKIPDLGENLPETSRATRGFRLMLDVQAALVLHMGQDIERVQRLYARWRRTHEDQRLWVVVDQFPCGLRRVGERRGQQVRRTGGVFEGVHDDRLYAVAVQQILSAGHAVGRIVVVEDADVILKNRFAERPAVDERPLPGP